MHHGAQIYLIVCQPLDMGAVLIPPHLKKTAFKI